MKKLVLSMIRYSGPPIDTLFVHCYSNNYIYYSTINRPNYHGYETDRMYRLSDKETPTIWTSFPYMVIMVTVITTGLLYTQLL